MEIRQLNIFLQLAEVLNFSQAGRNLGYSQSNISTEIQQLEQEVGAPLFNRIGRQVTLTQYGEELLPYAHQIVSTAAKMENFLKSEQALGGTLRFGVVDSLFGFIVEPLLLQYHKRFPRVKLEYVMDTATNLKSRLEQGTLDVACIVDDPVSAAEWDCRHKVEVPIVIAANTEHPLVQKKGLTLLELKDEKFVLMEDTVAYSAWFQKEMAERGIQLKTVAQMPSSVAACRVVVNGGFLSVFPQYNVRQSRYRDRRAVLDVVDFAQTQWVQTILHPNKILTPQVEGFLETFRTVIETVTA